MKIGKIGTALWPAHTKGQDPAIKSLHERTGRRKLSHEQTVHMKRFEEQVAGTRNESPNQFEFVGLVPGDQSWVPVTKFWSKNGRFTEWVLSPRLVAGSC